MGNFIKTASSFPRTFWVANTMELFERWAWYGLFNVLALYLTKSTDEGALGFSQAEKGVIMGTVSAILYFLPILTGSLADRFGFKRVLIVAYIVLASGYYLMGTVHEYYAVYAAFLYVAVGAALFKPVISATVARTTDDKTSSIGFGIFYMMVNIGGFLGPLFSSKIRTSYGWDMVFLISSASIILNLILVTLFYKEPTRQTAQNSVWQAVKTAFVNIFIALKDVKLSIFLIIMVGFWTVLLQLYYTIPSFIDQWVNTAILYDYLNAISPSLASAIGTPEGTIAPEMIMNIDALLIISFQLVVSTFVMRFKPVYTITGGIFINAFGLVLSMATSNPIYTIVGLIIYGFGEMTASPKYTEYIGRIAPSDKSGLYMGTSFLPVAAGNYFAGYFSGTVYEKTSDKLSFLQEEVMKRGLNIPPISESFTQNDFVTEAANQMQMNQTELTVFLWNNYHPFTLIYYFAAIGMLTGVLMILYDWYFLKNKKTLTS